MLKIVKDVIMIKEEKSRIFKNFLRRIIVRTAILMGFLTVAESIGRYTGWSIENWVFWAVLVTILMLVDILEFVLKYAKEK